jgi:phenylacetate-CoA ligase
MTPQKNAIQNFFLKLQGSAIIARHALGQRRIPYLPVEQLQAMRDRRIRELVRYAAATVPYYRDLFKVERIDPLSIRTAADLHRLPLLDKDVVRRHPEQFVSEAVKGKVIFQNKTSGSTGIPISLVHTRESLLVNAIFSQREVAVRQAMFKKGELKRFVTIAFQGDMSKRVRAFVQANAFVPAREPLTQLSMADPIEKVIDNINRLKPDVISTMGSYLELLFRTVKTHNLKMHVPKLAFYFSDMVTEAGRRLIEDEFGIPVLSNYSANEIFKIGFMCEARRGYHLHTDLVYHRIIDAHGRDLPPGESGEVVLSNLVNHGTVLLNYRLGDLGTLSAEPCSCGRTMPLLKNLEGRAEDILILPNGQYLHPRLIWSALRDRTDIVQYQLVQQAPAHFDLRLAMASQAEFDRNSAAIVACLQPVLGDAVHMTPVYQDTIHTYGTQKFRQVISLISREKLAEAKQYLSVGSETV